MDFRELLAYQKGFRLAMDIFNVSSFPPDEKYSLTDQIRRSSRSVCANLAEAYRKKIYPAHFVSKLTDCDAENSETGVWLDFAFASKYLNETDYKLLIEKNTEVGKMIHHMINNPEKY